MRQVFKFDESGFLSDILLVESNVETPDGYIEINMPPGLFKPRLVSGEVVEGSTPEELETIENETPEPTEIELLKQENEALKGQVGMIADVLDFILMNQ